MSQHRYNRLYECLPRLIKKFYQMVVDPLTDHLISWNRTGYQVIIHQRDRMAIQTYFYHNNYESLLKQLINYRFKRLTSEKSVPVRRQHPFIKLGDTFYL